MTAIILTALVATTPVTSTGLPAGAAQVGWASQYAPGVMARVVHNRQHGCCGRYALPLELPVVDGYVARPYPDEIGTLLWLRPQGGQPARAEAGGWERFLVADCGGVTDGGRSWMLDNNILVEVDYQTAMRWGTVGRGIRVEMRHTPPATSGGAVAARPGRPMGMANAVKRRWLRMGE